MKKTAMIAGAACLLAAASLAVTGCVTTTPAAPTTTTTPRIAATYTTLVSSVPSEARRWSIDEVTRQITNTTFLRNVPGQRNEVYYFSPDRIVYTWSSATKFVESATWVVEMRTPPGSEKQSMFICMVFPRLDDKGTAVVGPTTTRCLEPAVLYIPSVDHAQGDAFAIRGRKQPPFTLPIERTTIAMLTSR
jgi:hypothetical protein